MSQASLSDWRDAGPLDELAPGTSRLLRAGGRQIAVFRLEDDRLFAVDNICPHEGYPLVQGYVTDCLLTCAWHNFKFDLRDGSCVLGEEDVRSFPVRLHEGRIEVDLRPPESSAAIPRIYESLEQGMVEHELGRIGRDVVRLLESGVAPAEIAAYAARFDGERSPWGSRHALAVAADVLPYFQRLEGAEATLALLQPLELASFTNIRHPRRVVAPAADPGADAERAGARLRELIEQEKVAEAEGLLRGALACGWTREVVEPWLFALCCDHFLDFGHPLIYQIKLFDLIENTSWEHAEGLLLPHLVGIGYGTREDTLPPMAQCRRELECVGARLEEFWESQISAATDPPDSSAFLTELRDKILDARSSEAMAAVTTALERGIAAERIVDEIVLAACTRLHRFDIAIDADPTVRENWLHVTHPFTFANAVRHALERHRRPEVLRLLYHAAQFVNGKRALDAGVDASTQPAPRALDENGRQASARERAGHLTRCITAGDELGARFAVEDALAGLPPRAAAPTELRHALQDLALADPAVQPIVVAHVIKMVMAAFDEHGALAGHPDRALPLTALVRFMTSPIVENSLVRIAHESVNFVARGKPPRRLTG